MNLAPTYMAHAPTTNLSQGTHPRQHIFVDRTVADLEAGGVEPQGPAGAWKAKYPIHNKFAG